MAVLLFFYSKKIAPIYSVKSSVYPLTSGPDKTSATSKLTELIGGTGGAKSLSDEANVNIEEVAKSKKTREAVAGERIPEFTNKLVAEILIDEVNKNRSFYEPILEKPKTEKALISAGAKVLKDNYSAKFNKNSLLEIVYSHSNKDLISPISYILVAKISEFYIELKVKKAQFDLAFTEKKVDSLDKVLNEIDSRRINFNNHTLFVRSGKMKYLIPEENLENEKLQVLAQRNNAAVNREEAAWRKEKARPIIEILDKPEEPFDEQKPSKIIYTVGGFVLGCVIFSLLFISGIIYKYFTYQISETLSIKSIEPDSGTVAEKI